MTKYDKARNHLMSGKSLTGITAMDKFDLYRLSSFIGKMRAKGWKIETDMSSGYATYKLLK